MKMDRINAYMEQCKLELGLRVEACSRDDAARKDCPELSGPFRYSVVMGGASRRGEMTRRIRIVRTSHYEVVTGATRRGAEK